jgi:nondiscriminating glutamyl-tRNA synthetase
MDKNQEKPSEIRTRFAPSPTGLIQMGNLRTALFNYLFARSAGGKFILRIEDTDKERSKKEFEEDILKSLKWLNILWDEGPEIGGDMGPYRQSEKLEVYSKYLKKLLSDNKAYFCFCSEEDLEAQRQYQMSIGETPRYSGKCANLSKEESESMIKEGKPYVIRFRVEPKKVRFHDEIRGDVEFDCKLMGDIVIAKNLNSPLYNFSVVIDDHEMKISHVIRGEDHLSNTPKQILLQETLGFNRPKYAHLPLILAPDRTKLSKRHGAISVGEYKEEGYLPQAIVNFIAFLGWNPGGEREIYLMSDLIKDFSLDKIQKAGAIFNVARLDYLNGFYIRQNSLEKITELCLPYLVERGLISPDFETNQYPPAYGAKEIQAVYKVAQSQEEIKTKTLQKIISLYKERLKKLSEIGELADFFFQNPKYEKELLRWKKMADSEIKESLDFLSKICYNIESWTKENLEATIMPEVEKMGDRGRFLWPLRAALTGKKASAGPFEVADILGKEKTIARIRAAIEKL